MDQYNISGVPITADDRRLVGIITRRDLRFLESGETPVAEIMTKTGLVTATGTVSLDEAEKILMANKVEKLLLIDTAGLLTGLITIKDIDMMKRFPSACKDRQGRLRVGAAVAYSPVAWYGPVAFGGSFTVWGRYAAVGGGASGWVSRAIVVPALCAPGS
jgi:CBS-domain-containing membrane protein